MTKSALLLLQLIYTLLLLGGVSSAANRKIESVYSNVLSRKMDVFIVSPEDTADYIIWLLHGYGGSANSWTAYAKLDELSDKYHITFIGPSALTNGWYLDSPKKPFSNVKSYLTIELLQWLKERDLVLSRQQQWAIGTSMGGHGVLTLSLSSPDLWAGVSSIAGITELEAFPNNWELSTHLGTFSVAPALWQKHSFNSQLLSGVLPNVFILLDCGKSDFALNVNKNTDSLLSAKAIPHHFWSEKGTHDFNYVAKVMQKHIEFAVAYLKQLKPALNK